MLKAKKSYQGDLEWQLLEDSSNESDGEDPMQKISNHDLATAPLLTREAYELIERSGRATQYGVLGKALAIQCVQLFIYVTTLL